MFDIPIKHNRLHSMDELLNVSYKTSESFLPFTTCKNNGQIAFTDQFGTVWVTPYRSEISEILEDNGYTDKSFSVPYSNREKRPESYIELVDMANKENWAETLEEAHNIALEKCISPITLPQEVKIKQIDFYYEDPSNNTAYSSMVSMFLSSHSIDNIGTFIVVNEKTLLLCDDYGRTFLLKSNTSIDSIVDMLLKASYTPNTRSNLYVQSLSFAI